MGNMDFQSAVIEKSYEKPVIVDFWAPWCGPCRILGPVIEELAAEQAARWTLVKVNTEEEFEIAQDYQIMSIPNVKMFYRGTVIAEFLGALPKHSIMQWLEEHLPDERKKDLAGLLEKLSNGAPDAQTVQQLEDLVAANPDLTEARLALAGLLVATDPERASAMVLDIHLGDKLFDEAENIRTLARLAGMDDDDTPAGKLMTEARDAFRRGDRETAIQKVINATMIDKTYLDDLPRKTAIALFQTWGDQDELTRKYRRRFDMALY